jgi:hypothetical protein
MTIRVFWGLAWGNDMVDRYLALDQACQLELKRKGQTCAPGFADVC